MTRLSSAPPPIHQDEASNGYDGWSLMRTGRDRWGHRWPLTLEGFGDADNRPALYAYLTIPFHAVFGFGTLSTRLPAALAAVLTVAAVYALTRRVYGTAAGLSTALLLGISPWNITLSRVGHEASLTPVFTAAGLWLLDVGGFALSDPQPAGKFRPWLLMLAGVTFATSLYSYGSMLMFTPVMLIGLAIIYRKRLWAAARQKKPITALLAGFFITAGPIVYTFLTRFEQVGARGRSVSILTSAPPAETGAKIAKIASQWLAHYSPAYLFAHQQPGPSTGPSDFGQLHWHSLPLVLLGLGIVIYKLRKNSPANPFGWVLLLWLLFYPIASATTRDSQMPHPLRSACGMPAFAILGGVGLAFALSSLRRRSVVTTLLLAAAALMLTTAEVAIFLQTYFGPYQQQRGFWNQNETVRAVELLRSRQQKYKAVIFTGLAHAPPDGRRFWFANQSYIRLLMTLPYPPAKFQRAARKVVNDTDGEPQTVNFHRVEQVGKFFFSAPGRLSQALKAATKYAGPGKMLVVAIPGEFRSGVVVERIRDSYDEVLLELRELFVGADGY